MKILQPVDYPTAMKTAISFLSYALAVVMTTYIIKRVQFMRRNQKCKKREK